MPLMRFPRAVLLLLTVLATSFLTVSSTPPANAASRPLSMQTEDEQMVRWDLTADKMTTHNDTEIMEAEGNVILRRGNEYMKADFARYYMSTKWVYLKGNVVVKSGQDEITAEEAEFDLRSRVGWLKNGQIFMSGPHTYIYGSHISKHWGDLYTFRQAKITTCDGDVPAWSLTADEAVVEIDGYARLSRSTFQVMDTPVAFSPYMVLPVKTNRQTGFLYPEFGSTSEKGFYFNQPFFWAIDDSNDLTLNSAYMSQRGYIFGAEFRTRPSEDSAGWVRMDWLNDRQISNDDDSFGNKNDGLIRQNHDRYWVRGMYDGRLANPAWRLKADIDYVSDQDFIEEFKNFYGGYKYTEESLFDWFNRDLAETTDNRESGILLTREWERGAIAFSSSYTQNKRLGNGNDAYGSDDTVQHFPQFNAYLYKGRILPSIPLEFDASGQAGYMYRRDGTSGAKYQMAPTFTLPINTKYGSIVASAGMTQTYYETETKSKTDSDDKETGDTRTVFDFNIAGSTEFSRVYGLNSSHLALTEENLGETRWLALKHSIQPRVEFLRRPTEDQDNNPYYEPDDRLNPRTQLVYSITNVLAVKSEKVVMIKNDAGELEPGLQDFYTEFIRLRVQQAYDFKEATRDDERDTYERRPFGDVFGDLTILLSDQLSFNTRNDWSPYENEFTRHQSNLRYNFEQYGFVTMGYDRRTPIDEYNRKRRNNIQYLTLGGGIENIGPFSFAFQYGYDWQDTDNKEADIYLTYNHQCFQLIGRASVDPDEKSYGLSVVLTGLGD